MSLDISKLKAFICVVKWQSFTKAAAELFISQPALSKKISDFETELGVSLLVRNNRGMELTPAGKLLYEEAPALLKAGDDLEYKVRELGRRPGSRLSIGCSGIEYGRIHHVVNGFRLKHPDIFISMHRFKMATDIRKTVVTGMIDISFMVHFEVTEMPELGFLPFCIDELAVIMSKEHPLAGESAVSMEQLRDESYIAIQPRQGHLPFAYIINRLCEQGYQPKELVVADSPDSLILQVSCGMGIAHMFMQSKQANGGMVQYVRSKDPAIKLQVDMVWSQANQNPALALFSDYVRELNTAEGL